VGSGSGAGYRGPIIGGPKFRGFEVMVALTNDLLVDSTNSNCKGIELFQESKDFRQPDEGTNNIQRGCSIRIHVTNKTRVDHDNEVPQEWDEWGP
jgi:hypothetical protein